MVALPITTMACRGSPVQGMGRILKLIPFHPAMDSSHYPRLFQPPSNLALDTFRDGTATDGLGIPVQSLPTFPGKDFSLIFHQTLPKVSVLSTSMFCPTIQEGSSPPFPFPSQGRNTGISPYHKSFGKAEHIVDFFWPKIPAHFESQLFFGKISNPNCVMLGQPEPSWGLSLVFPNYWTLLFLNLGQIRNKQTLLGTKGFAWETSNVLPSLQWNVLTFPQKRKGKSVLFLSWNQ